ncbi:MAG: DEAD/DEAH box helicase family protein [Myxococcota bacterium]
MVPKPCLLRFHAGTLELEGFRHGNVEDAPGGLRWDPRRGCHRGPAYLYASVVANLAAGGIENVDTAAGWRQHAAIHEVKLTARAYQQAAVDAWLAAGCKGVVVLPTGAGKTRVALLAMAAAGTDALVIVPTLDLVRQWYDELRKAWSVPVGVIGGGEYEIQPLTVSTYDSAWLHMEHLGGRFGMLVFDECHHLPGVSWQDMARLSLAPARMGLTATPERVDGLHELFAALIGPEVYRSEINDLAGAWLSPYETERIEVMLDEDEREAYDRARDEYLAFLRRRGIHAGAPFGWTNFIRLASRDAEGRSALRAYRLQRMIPRRARNKLRLCSELVQRHRLDRVLLFTDDNATALALSQLLLIPLITHQTKVRERSSLLEGFRTGRYRALVTSRVLNEGVDVPEANVAIIVSGTSSIREHVQRLGRILRPATGKKAVLYELVTSDTNEQATSRRRRDHRAYR